MQSVFNGSALTASSFGLGSLFPPFLADMPGAGAIVVILCCLAIIIPLYFLIASFPLWISAKIAVSRDTTYAQALKVLISQFVIGLLVVFAAAVVAVMAGITAGHGASQAVSYVAYIIMFFIGIMITAGTYEIGGLHAFGVQLLSMAIALTLGCIAIFGAAAIVGGAAMHERLASSLQRFQNAQQNGNFTTAAPAPVNSVPTAPAPIAPAFTDTSAEVDSLLNAAFHPNGPRPSLTERENIVRSLQEKLRVEKSSLSAGDARAALVFQNQLNRYMALLEEVKAERKLHPLRDEVVTEKPAGRDYASPAQ